MKNEVVIDVQQEEISIALLEDGKLVEVQKEKTEESFSVGNIYVAKVKKLMPGLNASFINIGSEKDAFLHYPDLGSQFISHTKYLKQVISDRKRIPSFARAKREMEPPKDGLIQNFLEKDQEVLVQITKEPISTKGPRVSGEISLTGRYLILLPFGNRITVSSKIADKQEKARLRHLATSILPQNVGIIVRTAAEGKKVADLDAELKRLMARWKTIIENVHKSDSIPALVYEERHRVVSMLRDVFNSSFESIYVNDKKVAEEVREYVSLIEPKKKGIVNYYSELEPIFDKFDVTRQIKSSFSRIVSVKKGAYLVVEHTEALHVVDVNSGIRSQSKDGHEANALEVNLMAADELARQLRLRDMGGIIVVDFIDMDLAEDRQTLYDRMCENMEADRAKHQILPLTKFGLMQITRQRVRPVIDFNADEKCPVCMGTGKIGGSIFFVEKLEEKIDYVVNVLKQRKCVLYVHPYVYAYINKGLISIKRKWQFKYGLGLRVVQSQKLAFLQFEFRDVNKKLINTEIEKTEEVVEEA